MVGIIIASHGDFASGLKQTSEMIFGKQDNVETVSLSLNEGPEDIYHKFDDALSKMDCQQVIVFVDLMGGTPFNQINLLKENRSDQSITIITGMNLPILLECYGARMSGMDIDGILNQLSHTAKESIEIIGLKQVNTSEQNQPNNYCESIISKGKGRMEIALARVDSRLLHGQVATGWCKTIQPNRILVVSDSVAHDSLRKKMIMQAAPVGIKVNCIPLSKLIEIKDDVRFCGVKALVLFENIQDALEVIEKGVDIQSINLGSIAHKQNKVSVNTAISMDSKDIHTLETLLEKGIDIDIRKVPADNREDINALLSKARQLMN